METIIDILMDALIDSIKLIPFLFLTYLLMEYLEHKTNGHTQKTIEKAGKFGPIAGAVAGMLPQCGFSTAASNLYAARVISMGTLIAIYLSTSDEMLPIMISEAVSITVIAKILFSKMLIGMIFGFIIDFAIRKKENDSIEHHIHEMCEHEHCHCEEGILKPSLNHTLNITFFIFIISLILNGIIEFIGEDALAGLFLAKPLIGQMISAFIGLIPNCAASVLITQLYLDNIMSFGAMMSGLLTGAGVGLLVLFKVNKNVKENVLILILLYAIGVIVGTIIEVSGIIV